MACNKYGQNPLDVAGADMTRDSAVENQLFGKLQDIRAMLGGRVLDKHLREKEQEKRHDPAVDEKEKGNKTEDDVLSGIAKNLSLVAILIATVTFTAGFTLPGGLIQDKGSPVLKYNAAFIAFVITDSLSFVLSTSVVLLIFFAILGNKVPRGPLFVMVSHQLVAICIMLTIVAMGFMIIAFGTGLYAVLGVSKGFGVVTLLIVLSFFFIFPMIIIVTIIMKDYERSEQIFERMTVSEVDREQPFFSTDDSLFRVRDIQLSHIV